MSSPGKSSHHIHNGIGPLQRRQQQQQQQQHGINAAPDEQTPLIGASASVHTERRQQEQAHDDERAEPDDIIDPDDFDLLLTKSTSYTPGPLLGPESSETPLLRGERKYSTSHGSHKVLFSRRTSVCSGDGEEEAVDDDDDSDEEAALSPFHGGM
ncbi:hypothetical protein M406DRAFT_358320, partial [Cryphonectria parasitica EP155]